MTSTRTDRWSPTLGQAFACSVVGLGILLGALFYLLLDGSRRSIVEAAEQVARQGTARLAERIESHLYQAERALNDVEQQVLHGVARADDPVGLERILFAQVVANPKLAEAALTYSRAREDGGQISVFRERMSGGAIVTRRTEVKGGMARSVRRQRPVGGTLEGVPFATDGESASDPTRHPTFLTSTRPDLAGVLLWSDLSWSEIDISLPESERRIVVTVQKSLADESVVAVIRIALLIDEIEAFTRLRPMEGEDEDEPHRGFLCDVEGRLITRLASSDPLTDVDGALRAVPEAMPENIVAALAVPGLADSEGLTLDTVDAADGPLLVTRKPLARTQGWVLGIVVPLKYYLSDLERTRDRFVAASLGMIVSILVGGTVAIRAVRGGLAGMVKETARMRQFDFSPRQHRSLFRDVKEASRSLEQAKTAMRAMGKYVPIDLVRKLYESNREPTLGAEPCTVSLMFTDIAGFTSVAESMSPNRLAHMLGRYLEVMTDAIRRTGGTVDKYIGDAIMVLWNAPSPIDDHPARACRAALDCVAAANALQTAPGWEGLPKLVTRFGLHSDRVMVGHFGSPARLSYTALGDGVNLAARLEGLNKVYGTSILASQTIVDQVAGRFEFRRLDRVAVKGKTHGVEVFELLGTRDEADADRVRAARAYEHGLTTYLNRDFPAARAIFAALDDAASRLLVERCGELIANPPGADWTGTHEMTSK